MSSKRQAGSLGRSLVKEKRKRGRGADGSWRHTSELEDGYDWGRLNLRSVTEESRLDEFLSTAELAGTEFKAERLNLSVVDTAGGLLPSAKEGAEVEKAQEQNKQYLSIPRRPQWDASTTAEQLELLERESFLTWRRRLAELQENDKLILTPFEKNLDFWRQLWRVVERSDVVVQIVDARDPLLFRCEDLESYVREIGPHKTNMLLVSKADLLTPAQRSAWRDHFAAAAGSEKLTVAFWSALEEMEKQEEDDDDGGGVAEDVSSKLLTSEELIQLFHSISPVAKDALTTVGMVGYPNVGKSSTINALLQNKKVPVSATPGRTKHFQTLYVSDLLLLCDCPGLVFPSFVSSKAAMVCSGILPIDQLRDHLPPVSLVCQRIPRHVLEGTYSLSLPRPAEGEDPLRPPHANELLEAYGYLRGFMTHHGLPDCPRSARYILKDFVNGRLLYCCPPPGIEAADFNKHRDPSAPTAASDGSSHPQAVEAVGHPGTFDDGYFKQATVRAVYKGGTGMERSDAMELEQDGARVGKPWKKHFNKHKKEKTRRVQSTS